jgi:NAD(P)-dependent dehydrogenase (short-subunit alcohol dehydrogenase family)
MSLSDRRVVVITGGSAGVGRATARRFARAGASLGVLARDPGRLEATRAELEELGAKTVVVSTDVASAEQLETAALEVERELGPIDVWINNAMVSVFSPVIAMRPDEFRRVTDVTYLGVVYGTLTALRRMLPRDEGTIVQVGSALAYRGIPLQSAYCAAKHAVQGFCDSLRAELLHEGSRVRVTMVQLPALNTPQFDWVKSRLPGRAQPVPPVFQPEVAAEAIYRAASGRKREVHVGLPTVRAILGDKLFPGLLDRYLARTGYAAQQTDEAEDPGRANNLYAPVAGSWAAHGRFDSRSRDALRPAWGGWLAAGAAISAAALLWRGRGSFPRLGR